MRASSSHNKQDRLITKLNHLWKDERDHALIAETIDELNTHHNLTEKMSKEPGVQEIIAQMFGRLANSFERVSNIRDKEILDIACGSNTSKAPTSLFIDTPFGKKTIGSSSR